MRIKTVEIKGFKSFPDRTIVRFDQDITGIVGPNGCGKSNIVDAIRWVVGEQKISALRSENLESLVFNGSKTRAASGLAEVTLTFENTRNLLPTDFDSIAITRRFYKTGESEYRLNGIVCRLKDIQNLFVDTGISTDSYAIIELGMIDDIIKDKDNSRRKMLEQAAGVSIFKTRKRETQLKLQATEQDVSRLEDILFEINNQLKDLESQSRRALRYADLRKKYKEAHILHAKLSLKDSQQIYQEYRQKEKELSDKLSDIKTALSEIHARLEKEKFDLLQKEQDLRKEQRELNALERNGAEIQNEKNLHAQQKIYRKERERENLRFIEEASKQSILLEESIRLTIASIEEENKKIALRQNNVETQSSAVERIKDRLSAARAAQHEALAAIHEAQKTRFEIEKQIAVNETQAHNIDLSTSRLRAEIEEKKATIQDASENILSHEKAIAEEEISLREKESTRDVLRETILREQERIEAERARLVDAQRTFDAKQNEYDLLKNLIDSLEGYPESVKYLYKNKEWEDAPLLSDLLFVQADYRVCIERYLEPFMNYYVVENKEAAGRAIALLNRDKKGKANFFTLSTFDDIEDMPAPEQCVRATDAIEADPKYKTLVRALLGHVFIQETASDIPAQKERYTIISKDGAWISSRRSIGGGSIGSLEGKLIGRGKNLEKLQEEMNGLHNAIEKTKGEIASLQKNVAAATESLGRENIDELRLQIIRRKERLESLKATQEQCKKEVGDARARIEQYAGELEKTKKRIERLNADIHARQAEENARQEKKDRIEKELSEIEKTYQELQSALNEERISLTRQQNKIITAQNDLQHKEKQLKDVQAQIAERKRNALELETTLEENERKTADIENRLGDLLKEKDAAEKAVNALLQSIDIDRNAIAEKEKEARKIQAEKEEAEKEEQKNREALHALTLQTASIKERLQAEFKIDIEELLKQDNFGDTKGNIEETQEQILKIKKSIDNLGEVNPMSIEAYETHKKRYDFIARQKADLVEAKDNLTLTIKEVETIANQNFNETFNQVRTYFQRVFKKLFTEEDTADLALDAPDNFSETGIDIIAKPKGKRPSSISQLSGGEKTLTSIAFLFSLYLIKPAPFCILDEVDAPLDDANVVKFTKMIREFSKDSQFIIVTHNKSTMSSVDVIYGVTMQETGVSKLVPVDFRNLEQADTPTSAP